jgi:hypothetical protein
VTRISENPVDTERVAVNRFDMLQAVLVRALLAWCGHKWFLNVRQPEYYGMRAHSPSSSIPKLGRVDEFDNGKRKLVLVKTLAGGNKRRTG